MVCFPALLLCVACEGLVAYARLSSLLAVLLLICFGQIGNQVDPKLSFKAAPMCH